MFVYIYTYIHIYIYIYVYIYIYIGAHQSNGDRIGDSKTSWVIKSGIPYLSRESLGVHHFFEGIPEIHEHIYAEVFLWMFFAFFAFEPRKAL
jgi:hypothetical protein